MPVATAGPRRGLWIGLGAFIAVAALVAVAWVLPRVYSTKASQKPAVVATDVTSPAQAPQTATQPDNPPAAQQPETPQQPAASSPAETGTPSQAQTAASAGTKHAPASASHAAPGGSPASPPRPTYVPPAAPVAANAAPAASDPQPAAGPSPREMREAHDRFALLEGRADAALAGVDQIRSQQRAQGLDLRGDIIAAVNRLHNQLDMARQALAQKDLDTANDYMNRADNDTGRLEKFLGR